LRSHMLSVALSPIGSLSLRKRVERDKRSLSTTFNLLSLHATTLTLSPSGYRIVECFLNANEDAMNVGLSDSLSGDWNELEQVLKTVKGRHLCEILLDRKMKTFAHNLITKVPVSCILYSFSRYLWRPSFQKGWWFTNNESLSILIKALDLGDIEVAKEFISSKETEADLCNTAEGFYCVLKVRMRSNDQPGCRSSLDSLILRKAKSIEGSEALVQVILYGNLMTKEIIEIVCRRESFDDSPSVSLISRLIESSSEEIKRVIFECLCHCLAEGNPLICQIRFSDRFDDIKKACDIHFTLEQRQQLDDCLAETTVESAVDECLNAANVLDGHPEIMMRPPRDSSLDDEIEIIDDDDEIEIIEDDDEIEILHESICKKPEGRTAVARESTGGESTVAQQANENTRRERPPSLVDTDPQQSAIRKMFDEVDAAMKDGTWNLKQSSDYANNFIKQNVVQSANSRKLFSDLLEERISMWLTRKIGRNILKIFVRIRSLQLLMSVAVASVLHCLTDLTGDIILHHMVSSTEYREFIEVCLVGDPSPFARLFHSELTADECMQIGMQLTQTWPERIHDFLTHFGLSIAETKNGQLFIERLTKGSPEGYGWRVLMKFLPPIPNILVSTESTSVDGRKCKKRKRKQSKRFSVNNTGIQAIQGHEQYIATIREMFQEIDARLKEASTPQARDLVVSSIKLCLIIASVLHCLSTEKGLSILGSMLSPPTRRKFIDKCLVGGKSSYFAYLFRSELPADECVSIGIKMFSADPERVRIFLSQFDRSISETEQGKMFIDLLPPPSPPPSSSYYSSSYR
ncbi:hypothetical protein PMAYCL1PPCAC_13199, partial [Pristionchus mayeri]